MVEIIGKPTVLFVANGSALMRYGGSALRNAATEKAMRECATVTVCRLRCPDDPECTHAAPSRGDEMADFHSTYCAVAADWLLDVMEKVRPSIVVASGLEMWRYLDIAKSVTDAVCVLDLHNVDSLLRGEIAAMLSDHPHGGLFSNDDATVLQAIEAEALRWVDHVWTCTDIDAKRLSELHGYPLENMTVVPNAIVPPSTQPVSSAISRVFFPGRLDWFPNYLAAEFLLDEVFPRLERLEVSSEPLSIVLAGFNPPTPLLRRALPPRVQFLASPPTIEDLWEDSVLAVPLTLGSGSRLKILESFAKGCPVVSSAKGIEGIDARDGTHYLLAESADEMVEAICLMRSDHAMRERLTRAAFDLVNDRYSASSLSPIMTDNFRSLLGTN